MKYYAVKKGRQTGIFKTWDECKKHTVGFSSAVYKSFTNLEDAEAFLGTEKSNEPKIFEAVSYVDGSYNVKTHEYSYGVVMLHNNEEHHFCMKFNDKELADMRNVSGEIKGAEFAMQYCLDNHIKSVQIHYDYEGVSKWCLGEWKANKDGTKAYKAFFESTKNDLFVKFIKVKSHSGDKYNDLADELAKRALGIL